MKQRYRILSTDYYDEATKAKALLIEKFPDKIFQIRKTHKGFNVVERVPTSEALEKERVSKYPKRKGKRRGNTYTGIL